MSISIQFTKMEGLGNDYVFVDITKFPIEDPASLSQRISDRHLGIGSDGLVLIGRSERADFSMRIFNADGSEATMCGNASRCIGKYVYDKGMTTKKEITLETLSGIRSIKLHTAPDDTVDMVTMDMGQFTYDPSVSVVSSCGRRFEGYCISVGNPHFVVFTDELTLNEVEKYGPAIEADAQFPDRTNVEFARIVEPDIIRMRVWERGSGITMACGTGACATASAAVTAGLIKDSCNIVMDGGTLLIEMTADDRRILMTGPAKFVFEGTINIK